VCHRRPADALTFNVTSALASATSSSRLLCLPWIVPNFLIPHPPKKIVPGSQALESAIYFGKGEGRLLLMWVADPSPPNDPCDSDFQVAGLANGRGDALAVAMETAGQQLGRRR
jgi:hypothetical protein